MGLFSKAVKNLLEKRVLALDSGKRVFFPGSHAFSGYSDPLLATPLSMGQGVHVAK